MSAIASTVSNRPQPSKFYRWLVLIFVSVADVRQLLRLRLH